MRFIDLSVAINQRIPVYPGDPAIRIEPVGVLSQDGYEDHFVSLGTHVGTHIDAPRHMITGGRALSEYPPGRFIGRGVLVAGFQLAAVERADVQPGDIVLCRTDMSKRYREPVYFEDYPVMSEQVADYLIAKQPSMVGVDTCSVDNQDGFPIHKKLLAADILIIENLTNLAELAEKAFKVYALPLKLELDGAPARVVAELT
jgi:arylformamidase